LPPYTANIRGYQPLRRESTNWALLLERYYSRNALERPATKATNKMRYTSKDIVSGLKSL